MVDWYAKNLLQTLSALQQPVYAIPARMTAGSVIEVFERGEPYHYNVPIYGDIPNMAEQPRKTLLGTLLSSSENNRSPLYITLALRKRHLVIICNR